MTTPRSLAGLPVFCLALAALATASCTPLNDNPPVAVGNLAAFRESSDAIGIRFSLLDGRGEPTTSAGKAQVSIFQIAEYWSPVAGRAFERREQLHLLVFDVAPTDFVEVRVGSGGERHDTIVYNVGVIPYADFSHRPSASHGLVELVFHTPTADSLRATDTLVF